MKNLNLENSACKNRQRELPWFKGYVEIHHQD